LRPLGSTSLSLPTECSDEESKDAFRVRFSETAAAPLPRLLPRLLTLPLGDEPVAPAAALSAACTALSRAPSSSEENVCASSCLRSAMGDMGKEKPAPPRTEASPARAALPRAKCPPAAPPPATHGGGWRGERMTWGVRGGARQELAAWTGRARRARPATGALPGKQGQAGSTTRRGGCGGHRTPHRRHPGNRHRTDSDRASSAQQYALASPSERHAQLLSARRRRRDCRRPSAFQLQALAATPCGAAIRPADCRSAR
jgi:hypothetical protein